MCLSRKEETEAETRPHPVVAPVTQCRWHYRHGTLVITNGAASSGSSVPSWTLNPARAAMSHLLLCAFGPFLPGGVGEKTKDA